MPAGWCQQQERGQRARSDDVFVGRGRIALILHRTDVVMTNHIICHVLIAEYRSYNIHAEIE